LQFGQVPGVLGVLLAGVAVCPRGLAGFREQSTTFGFDLPNQVIATAAGDFAQRVAQRLLQVIAGRTRGSADVLRPALFGPKQAGNAVMLRFAGTTLGQLIAQQFSQLVVRFIAAELLLSNA